ncbi:MAG: DUF58 domain-containing protein [Lachnospiraceae bacterium]
MRPTSSPEASRWRKIITRIFPQDTFLYVYPGDVSIDRLKLPMHRLGGVLEGRRGMVEDPFAFAGMREYDGTDPMNRINWKASARSGNLMVNLQNSTYSPRVACFVDVEDVTMWKHMEIHEEAIRLAASLLRSVLKKAFPHLFTRTARIFFPAAWFRCRRAAEEARPRRSTVP